MTLLEFADLNGWDKEDHAAAFDVFKSTCTDVRGEHWAGLCEVASQNPNPRLFFETFFTPLLIDDGTPGLFTGYFEPELRGSLRRSARYKYPVYKLPANLDTFDVRPTRREIEQDGVFANKGLEIAWVDDPVELFFLQIQGSGRIRLPNGKMIRVGYAGANGHPYRSIGSEMVRRGILGQHQVSAQRIQEWVNANPDEGQDILWHNPSFVFFREVSHVPAAKGPLGAMNRSISTMRTVAIDPSFIKLGAPVWIEKAGRVPMNRLMVAQDTGSAIKGSQRADIFFGTGTEAGLEAGKIKDPGRLVVLLPTKEAFSKVYGEK